MATEVDMHDIAALAGLSIATVKTWPWFYKNFPPATKTGGKNQYLYNRAEVIAFINEHKKRRRKTYTAANPQIDLTLARQFLTGTRP